MAALRGKAGEASVKRLHRRCMLFSGVTAVVPFPRRAFADEYVETSTGLRYFDIEEGKGKEIKRGDRVRCHWSGYTAGYQAKRIENTSIRDDPFIFTVGSGEVIPAFDEAVQGMRIGGIRRVVIPGELPELMWPLDKGKRYEVGPKPSSFDGRRALDFVLDNRTFRAGNRTILIDIKLLGTT